MFAVEIQNDAGYAVDELRLRLAVITVLTQQNAPPDSSLTVVITDNDSVAALNRRFRGLDAPTDVLSFPADPAPIALEDEPPYLGDLIIAYPYAAAQAERAGHDIGDNLVLLVVHGTLHLLGFDHDTPKNRASMWTAQETAIHTLQIAPEIIPALESDEHEA